MNIWIFIFIFIILELDWQNYRLHFIQKSRKKNPIMLHLRHNYVTDETFFTIQPLTSVRLAFLH